MSDSLRILVVDDDTDAADSLAELFDMEGHDVEVAYSGERAIQAYREGHFDIAFMDIMMPGKNGVESFFEIRKMRPDAKVYMMTGFSVEQLVQQAIQNGAMGVLSKPLDLQKVVAVVDEVKPEGVVLIAEDDPNFGPQLAEMISQGGYACKLAVDGQEALDCMSSDNIDILILDLKLPVIDGIEVYTRLKSSDRTVPTIIITGQEDEHADTLQAIKDVKVTGILNKPFDPAILLDQLKKLAA
ncbi:MAG: response regulator [Rhizobiales bacterium]|nr:response regulator [Hyphomicrobiales bacterium]